MCGIVAYTGTRQAAPLILAALKKLEYRGYDSGGLAVMSDGVITVEKQAGKLRALEEHLGDELPQGVTGLGHTRWATHGAPNRTNAHPHTDGTGTIVVVHNGIFENFAVVRELLSEKGHEFLSETDTEVFAHLVGELYSGSLEGAVVGALRQMEGAYGVAVISSHEPGTIVAARRGSPLLVCVGEGENWVTSDAAATLEHSRSVVYLDDGEVAVVTPDEYRITDLDSTRLEKTIATVDWDLSEIERGGYEHFMLKEIMEQPESISDTLRGRLLEEEGGARLGGLHFSDEELLSFERIVLTACGTSWHAALIGEYMIEELAQIPTEVEYASEFRYRSPVLNDKTLVIGISQSGETADTLAALKEARARGARTMGIVNVVGSSIAREVECGVYLHSGPEIGVASTKAFTSQIVALTLLSLKLGRLTNLSVLQGRELVQALRRIPGQVREVLGRADRVESIAEEFKDSTNFLYLGRGYNFPVALEGALKLKEISYIHAEGYPAAEMKHGPIALIDEKMPVVFMAPRDAVYSKIASNIQEVKARGGRVIALVTDGNDDLDGLVDYKITIPETLDPLTPLLCVLPLQMLAYQIAVKRGTDVDQPRNLAKSVTVE
ncbi:MAG: glutamine--fructose-6-phosphate transaminase (isomerizing) [Gemmatimonadetes bacterium]|nr:glutamine--fructose-6-phosphate transaminase (isomerizing) [Gemmatimonadota bacterium]